MSALERKPQVLARAPVRDIGPGTDWRGIPRSPSQLVWRLASPEDTSELKPQEHAEVYTGLRYYTQCLAAASRLLSSCLLQPVSPLSTSDVEAVEEGHTSPVQDQLLPFRFEAAQH